MRVTRIQAEANREAVIDAASQLFREHGFDGIGLKDLMNAAGLTQGAFYKQFRSKDDLIAQASRRALARTAEDWLAAAADTTVPFRALVSHYLSMEHRAGKSGGCPLVALGADAARQNEEVRVPFQEGIEAHLRMLDGLLPNPEGAKPYPIAATVLSLMVGALTISRVMTDTELAEQVLKAAKEEIFRIVQCASRAADAPTSLSPD